jgi:hypothetical protein
MNLWIPDYCIEQDITMKTHPGKHNGAKKYRKCWKIKKIKTGL